MRSVIASAASASAVMLSFVLPTGSALNRL